MPQRTHNDQDVAKAETRRIKKLKMDFAIDAGWPDLYQYFTTHDNWERLKAIPGSFAAEESTDCPVFAIEAAALDIIPTLLSQGNKGKYIAFGYGRHWYALGNTDIEAMQNLQIAYPDQMPKLWGQVTPARLHTSSARRYYAWKATCEAPHP